jgi:hypothetical protein
VPGSRGGGGKECIQDFGEKNQKDKKNARKI